MSSSATDGFSVQELELEESVQNQPVQWVLSSSDPPDIWTELSSSIRETLLPNGRKGYSLFRDQPMSKIFMSMLQGLFPILIWGRNYDLSQFKSDLMAGLTLASLCIPQSIGYANLARLDPQFGLYTSFIPPLIYVAMGSSREIAIGPVAVVSLLLSSMIQKIVDPLDDPSTYRKLVLTATFFAGLFQAAFGLFRLGFLVDFLSHATIVGFMGGAAIMISLQQLKGLFGISHFTNKTDVVSVMKSVLTSVNHPWHALDFLIGSSFLIFILITRFIGRRYKKFFWVPAIAPLVSVILSTLLVFVTRADKNGIRTVKHIKGGINPISAHQLLLAGPYVGEAARIGLICALVALTEAIAVGRSFASMRGYHLDGNKEMVAFGFMNIAGSLTSCYAATGSFSRTAVNFSAGCRTAFSNMVMAVTVLLTLELLTSLLYFTPIAILASIILSSLLGLIDVEGAYAILEVDKLDFLSCIGAFFGVLFASVEIGLLVAVTISFARILLNFCRAGTVIMGRIPATDIFCSIKQYPIALKIPGVLIIRIDSAMLCFFNANRVREIIMQWVNQEAEAIEKTDIERIQAVILDLSNVINIDTTGIMALEDIHKKLLSLDLCLAIANPGWQVIHKLKLAKFVDKIGVEWIFLTVAEAVHACLGSKKCCMNR